MKVRLTFLEPVLGTWPSNENIARDFIASKAPDASTEEIPAGSSIELDIVMLDEKAHKDIVLEWLDYGRLRGIGQWRNSGKGRFTYEVLAD